MTDVSSKVNAESEEARRCREARSRAEILEILGDLPKAESAPPENVLFVCKLNKATESEDLKLIFSRFGKIISCEVIRDSVTGESLNYAFVEFEAKEQCQTAYSKMENVLIDERRIHVDFSQSVAGVWQKFKSGEKTQRKSTRRPHDSSKFQARKRDPSKKSRFKSSR